MNRALTLMKKQPKTQQKKKKKKTVLMKRLPLFLLLDKHTWHRKQPWGKKRINDSFSPIPGVCSIFWSPARVGAGPHSEWQVQQVLACGDHIWGCIWGFKPTGLMVICLHQSSLSCGWPACCRILPGCKGCFTGGRFLFILFYLKQFFIKV